MSVKPPSETQEDPKTPQDEPRAPSMSYSLLAVALVAVILLSGTLAFGAAIELLMFLAMVALIPMVMRLGCSYANTERMMFDAMRSILGLVLILIAVGALISSWALSGTIPTIISLGLQLISPSWFLVTALILCSMTSLVTGTSWGTMGSAGVALMAVGTALGAHPGLTAGAIVSGAYFGDKLSPLSDSTNLSAAITGTPLMTHIRYMLITTVPAYVVTAGLFTVLGFNYDGSTSATESIQQTINGLEASYDLGLITLVPVVVTVGLLFARVAPFVAILLGALTGGILAVPHQGASVQETLTIMHSGYTAETGLDEIDSLVSGGGVLSMAGLAFLFMFAVGTSGLLSGSGMVNTIISPVLTWANTPRRLMLATPPTVLGGVALGASFSFGAVMSGTILSPAYDKMRLRRENLSRTIEDSGTVYDAFFPWSGGGVFAAGALGVATVEYMPFMFFAFLSTIFGILVAITQFKVRYVPHEPSRNEAVLGEPNA